MAELVFICHLHRRCIRAGHAARAAVGLGGGGRGCAAASGSTGICLRRLARARRRPARRARLAAGRRAGAALGPRLRRAALDRAALPQDQGHPAQGLGHRAGGARRRHHRLRCRAVLRHARLGEAARRPAHHADRRRRRRSSTGPTERAVPDGQRLGDPPQRSARSPSEIWDFVKKHGFLGMLISKEHGGLGFSPQAQSLILGKIASRSPDVVHHRHGAELAGPGRADREIRHARAEGALPAAPRQGPGGALLLADRARPPAPTPPPCATSATSRAALHEGKEVLGIRLSWDKRYITLGPKATLVGLAFRLFDPDNLLGRGEDIGITVALIPAEHPGVNIGRRHLPSGAAFPNGPNWGKRRVHSDGLGDRRRQDGRPGLAHADGVPGGGPRHLAAVVGRGRRQVACCASLSAYARIRKQFGLPDRQDGGRSRSRSRAWSRAAYVNEAARGVTAAMVRRGEKPSVISAHHEVPDDRAHAPRRQRRHGHARRPRHLRRADQLSAVGLSDGAGRHHGRGRQHPDALADHLRAGRAALAPLSLQGDPGLPGRRRASAGSTPSRRRSAATSPSRSRTRSAPSSTTSRSGMFGARAPDKAYGTAEWYRQLGAPRATSPSSPT